MKVPGEAFHSEKRKEFNNFTVAADSHTKDGKKNNHEFELTKNVLNAELLLRQKRKPARGEARAGKREKCFNIPKNRRSLPFLKRPLSITFLIAMETTTT